MTTSSVPTYISDFEDNTVATPTNATLGVSMATTVGSGDPHTVKSSTKKDAIVTATDHVSEDLSSEGDTLVDHNNSSQLDSTLQNGMTCSLYNCYVAWLTLKGTSCANYQIENYIDQKCLLALIFASQITKLKNPAIRYFVLVAISIISLAA